jgi:hypothetical protein
MRFTASLLALCAVAPIESATAAASLSCTAPVAPCPPLQKILGACANVAPAEIVCRTESKSVTSPARSSKTSFGYYPPPNGYAFEAGTARAVFEGQGTHGVDASISDGQQLYCLWGTAGGGHAAGYCEVRARPIGPR